jgi:Protein of unknown function (DUF1018)
MTREQLAVVHLAKKELRWNDDMYRAVLRELGGVESAKDLTPDGFKMVMEYAVAWGFRSDWMKRTYGERPGMASPRQVELIRELWREWSGGDDAAALDRWLDHSFGVTSLRFATPDKASKAINGLKKMLARRGAKPPRKPVQRAPRGGH